MRLSSIHIHPIKSLRASGRSAAEVEPWGLAGDRRWLIVDGQNRFLTQRQVNAFATVDVTPTAHGLRLKRRRPGRGRGRDAAGRRRSRDSDHL